jgi:Ca2+-binding EF-hand superfamily protein
MKALIILVAVMIPLATAAGGDRPVSEKRPTPTTETFKSLDRNGDQSISKVEAKADRTIAAVFDTADINLDGYISKSEYAAYLQRASEMPPKQE